MSRRTRKRGDDLAPALFPFLAVLLCTMGALVVVLVLVVSQASASAKHTLLAQQDQLQEASDLVEMASEEMKARRELQQKAIDNKRSQLTGIEDHISRLIDELAQLEKTAKAIEEQSNTTDQQRREQAEKIANIESRLREEKAKLDEERLNKAKEPPAFAIIPYQGSGGTSRRPIYIECTAKGIIIQPEGVVISIDDLKPPHGPGNPLDASLRMIRSAYLRLDPNASSAVSPYPLLLVRPDGIKSYVLARAAMSGWDDQFGYELIDQNMPLAFPPSVPGLAPQLVSNLEVARQRQAALIAAMPRKYAMESVWDEALEGIDADPSEGLGGVNRKSEVASNDWSSIDGDPKATALSSNWKMVQEFAKGQSNSAPVVGEAKSHMAQSTNPSPITPSQPNGTSLSASDRKLAASGNSELKYGSGELWSDPTETGSPNAMGAVQSARTNGVTSMSSSNPTSSTNQAQSDPRTSTNGTSLSNTANVAPSADARNQSMSQPNAMNTAANGVDPKQMTEREATSQNGSASINIPAQNSISRSDNEKEQAVVSNSRSWTTKRRFTNGTSVKRPITLVVMPDRWFVMQDNRSDQVDRVITLESGPGVAQKNLDNAINDRVDSWGVAVAGGHWEPQLDVQVAPHAELSAQRFLKIMEESGLEIQLKPLP
jgi:hypothetical protein